MHGSRLIARVMASDGRWNPSSRSACSRARRSACTMRRRCCCSWLKAVDAARSPTKTAAQTGISPACRPTRAVSRARATAAEELIISASSHQDQSTCLRCFARPPARACAPAGQSTPRAARVGQQQSTVRTTSGWFTFCINQEWRPWAGVWLCMETARSGAGSNGVRLLAWTSGRAGPALQYQLDWISGISTYVVSAGTRSPTTRTSSLLVCESSSTRVTQWLILARLRSGHSIWMPGASALKQTASRWHVRSLRAMCELQSRTSRCTSASQARKPSSLKISYLLMMSRSHSRLRFSVIRGDGRSLCWTQRTMRRWTDATPQWTSPPGWRGARRGRFFATSLTPNPGLICNGAAYRSWNRSLIFATSSFARLFMWALALDRGHGVGSVMPLPRA